MTKQRLISAAGSSALILFLGNCLPIGADEHKGTPNNPLRLHDPDGMVFTLISGDGKLIISAGESLKVWDATTGRELRRLHSWPWGTNGISLSSDARIVAACGVNDPLAAVWDVSTGTQLGQFRAGGQGVGGIALSPDGKYLATKGKEGLLRLWDLQTRKSLWSAQQRPIMRSVLAFSSDGSLLASEDTFVLPSGETASLRIHETATGKERNAPNLASIITSIAFSPNGDLIALGDVGGRTGIWELKTGRLKHLFHGHSARIDRLLFTPDGLRLVSAGIVTRSLQSSKDGKVEATQRHDAVLWDVESGAKTACFPYDGPPPAFSSDGKLIAVSESRGQTITLQASDAYLRLHSLPKKDTSDK